MLPNETLQRLLGPRNKLIQCLARFGDDWVSNDRGDLHRHRDGGQPRQAERDVDSTRVDDAPDQRQLDAQSKELMQPHHVSQPEDGVELHLLSISHEGGHNWAPGFESTRSKSFALGRPLKVVTVLVASDHLVGSSWDAGGTKTSPNKLICGVPISRNPTQIPQSWPYCHEPSMKQSSRDPPSSLVKTEHVQKNIVVVRCVEVDDEISSFRGQLLLSNARPFPKPAGW
mmetsp:Transcript_16472/g.39193  ORF Transcript_16472/g.39193 Transcript_16472/m.39193 type:complete len:228 (+) Transcript_16472:103-786(+)